VTSRGTGRWVLPKGNTMKGLSAHAAAAQEAFEEAGVEGAVCPTPLGQYSYRKQLKSGASLMVDVLVFPLAVTAELPHWPEAEQRTRQWFPLSQAVTLVDEPDLRHLMRSFSAADFAAASQASFGVSVAKVRKGFRMFHWFQSLLPKQGHFFELFEQHVGTLTAGSDALARLLQGGNGMNQHIKEIIQREEEADAITREVLVTVRKTFLTPFDRAAITSLISSMDDAIDQMQQTAGAISLYEVTEFEQEMRDMAAIIVDASRLLAEALPLLRDIHANAARLHELTERLVRMEGQADDIHAKGLKRAFKQYGRTDTLTFFVQREIYSHLEKVVDRFEDVANEIDGLVIDHA
jgi:predicted phosphate transport protein (TIGR00153 family)